MLRTVKWLVMAMMLMSMAHAETAATVLGIPVPEQLTPANIAPEPLKALVSQPATTAVAAPVNVSNDLPGTYSWFAARHVCQSISSTWRLPTIEELLSRTISFAYAGRYWSASEYGIGIAWSYDAINKQASLNAVDSQLHVYCVP